MCQIVKGGLLTEIWLHVGIQGLVIDTGFGLDDFVELTLVKMYSRCCRLKSAASIFKKVPEPIFTS